MSGNVAFIVMSCVCFVIFVPVPVVDGDARAFSVLLSSGLEHTT